MIKLFTHTDLDGVGCAVLAKLAFGDDVDIEYCGYDNIDMNVMAFHDTMKELKDVDHAGQLYDDDMVFITDISIKDEVAKLIDEYPAGGKWRLFDHHKTAEHLNRYDWCEVSEFDGELGFKTCGTDLFYKHLTEEGYLKDTERYRTFVWAVTMYDTWMWKNMNEEEGKIVKEFNDLLYILGRDEFIARCIRRRNVKGDDAMILPSKDERMLLDIRQREIDSYINKKELEMFVMQLCGKNAMIVFADRFVSELGNTLCEEYPEYDLAVIIDPGSCKVSYRTIKDDVDVSEIARLFSGGGHPKAAGHVFNNILRKDMARNLFFYHIGDEPKPEPEKKTWWQKYFGGML